MEIIDIEKPIGVIVQYGGQTPLNLAEGLKANGVKVIGTSPESIALAEDREKFKRILDDLGLRQPVNETALEPDAARAAALRIGYPILLRPTLLTQVLHVLPLHAISDGKLRENVPLPHLLLLLQYRSEPLHVQ